MKCTLAIFAKKIYKKIDSPKLKTKDKSAVLHALYADSHIYRIALYYVAGYVVLVNRVYVNVCFCFNQRRVFKCWAISRPSWNKRESSENFKERIVTLIKCRRWMVGNYKKATFVPREIYKFNFNKLIVWKGILFSQNKRETWMHYAVVVTQPRKTSKDTKTNTKIACMINGCIYRCIAEYSPFIHVSAATIYFRSSFIKEGFFFKFHANRFGNIGSWYFWNQRQKEILWTQRIPHGPHF